MIRPEIALLVWMPIAVVLMVDRNSARGFSIALLGALFVLPSAAAVDILGAPRLDKLAVANVGILLGTVFFHPALLLRFRPRRYDALLILLLVLMVVTSIENGLGAYDGISVAFAEILQLILLIFLARVHLNRPESIRTFGVCLVLGAALYTPLVLWEWRMSPQIHFTLYGFFQHQFAQFHRWGFFRPVVCFPHALDLGRFMAFAAFLGAFPLRTELRKRLPLGQWIFLAPLCALLLSMSFGPYLLFLGFVALYLVFRIPRASGLAYALPGLAFLMAGMMVAGFNSFGAVADAARVLDPDRADNLQYRIDALNEYQAIIMERPWLGHAGWSRGRLSHRATDAELLIRALKQGLAGAGVYFAWWFCVLHTGRGLAKRARRAPFEPVVLGILGASSAALAFSVVDRALDPHIVAAAAGLVAVDSMMRAGRLAPLPSKHELHAVSGPAVEAK